MSGVAKRIDRLQNSEYTGANRCMACTVVNSGIALVLAAIVGAVGWTSVASGVGIAAAAATLVVSAASIYFRGYLIPGTPTLTKRYFPDWFLAYFEKAPPTAGGTGRDKPAPGDPAPDPSAPYAHTYTKMPDPDKERVEPNQPNVDPEAVLLQSGALEECEDVDDLCLSDEFKTKWEQRVESARESDAGRDRLIRLLDLEDAEVKFKEYNSAFRVMANGRFIGRWESEGAFLADVAAGELLEDRVAGWDDLEVRDRGSILNGLRLFIETCPSCGGAVSMGTELVESCCRSQKVAALTCTDCDERLFESNAIDD